jgi:hypothetical protein
VRGALGWARARGMAADGVSQREIARRLGINRRTVKRMLESDQPPAYRRAAKGSKVDRFEPVIRATLAECPNIKAPRMTDILRDDHGYEGSVDNASWPTICASLFDASCVRHRTRSHPGRALGEPSPPRRRRDHPQRRHHRHPQRKVRPSRGDPADAAVDQPASQQRLAVIDAPPQHLEDLVAQHARRRDEPHPRWQRIHNMSSASHARPGRGRHIWRSRSR